MGLTFKNEDEEEYINKLPLGEKHDLKSAMIGKFPQIDRGHILYLMSKSRSKMPVKDFKKIIENLYRYLDDIPEISSILQVLQYTEYLDIVFDFDNENVKDIDPTASDSTKGITDYKDGRIYIAAGTDEKNLAGTLSHELAHLAFYILYKNDCNPFDEIGNSRNRFEEITEIIREKLKDTVNQMSGYENDPIITLARAFRYPKNEQPSELIVRVPHILAQYSAAGRNLFLTHKELKLLFDYYNDQDEGGLLYRCKEMIKNNFLIKPRKGIQFFNETLGKCNDMIKYGIYFENPIDLDFFLNSEKLVFLLVTTSTLLSMLNVYNSLIMTNKNHSLQDSFLLDFNCFLEKEDEILQLFYSPAGKVLCISYPNDSNKEHLSNAFNCIKELLNQKPDKKVIFIIQESETEMLSKLTSTFHDNYEKSVQLKFTLNDFTKESQLKLLERKITFQGENIKLSELFNVLDDNAKTVIDTNILVKLIKNERIDIGRKPSGMSDLEGAYSELFQEIDIDTFVDELLLKKSKTLYIISGIPGSNKQDNLLNYFISKIEDINKISQVHRLKSHTEVLYIQDVCRDINKSVQVTGDQFQAKHFKQMCYNNPTLKIHWIHLRKENDDSQFVLQRIYNPDFYVTDKRINREVVIEKTIVRELTSSELSERYIIGMNQKWDIQEWFALKSEQEIQFIHNIQNNKIQFVYIQDNAEYYFPESFEANETVHLLKFKKDHLIWYKSHGSLNNLIKYKAKGYKNIQSMVDKIDAFKIILKDRVSIIAGDPGTGKSNIIARLHNTKYLSQSGQVESIIKSHWVIKVNLKDHVASIKKMMFPHCDINAITEFLSQSDLNLSHTSSLTFAKSLIGLSLQKNNYIKPLLLLFDGFDEILDEVNRSKIISLLQYLKDKTYAKFCITTRLHHKEDLERALSTFAFKLEPMDCSTIHTFIAKSFSNRLCLKLSQYKIIQLFDDDARGMLKYTDAFLSKMQEVFKNNITAFIGTPLQLFLMSESADDSFLKWVKDSSKNPDFSYLGQDVWQVYENFVNKRYDYFCMTKTREKEKKKHQEDIKNIDKYHIDLATSLIIFKSDPKESLKNIEEIILSTGIVRSDGNQFAFIHPTFEEYFAAKAILYWIRKWIKKSKSELINFEKQKYFLVDILRGSDYRVIRTFLNAKLLKERYKMVKLKKKYYDIFIIFVAVKENHAGIAKFIFDNFSSIDVNVDCIGHRYLTLAAASGHLEIIKLLIEEGANVNAVDNKGRTALYLAAQFGYLEIVKLLIDRNANVNVVDEHGRTVLYAAANYGHLEIVILLFDKGIDLDFAFGNGYNIGLNGAAQSGHLNVVKLLVKKGANVNAIDELGQTALYLAVEYGHLRISKFLIDKDANVNIVTKYGRTALYAAVEYRNLEIVTLLVDKGADLNFAIDNGYDTPLKRALKLGDLVIVKLLVDKGANVNFVHKNGTTALYEAAASGYLEIVNLLIVKGAYVNIMVKDQKPLNAAAACGHLELVELLLEKGAKINAVDAKGQTALYLASVYGYLEIIKVLIHRGANVKISNKDGRTALHAGALCGHLEIVKFLIEKGAKLNAVDKCGKTALHLATDFGIIELLRDKDAKAILDVPNSRRCCIV